jgi:zinc protease
MTYLPTLRRPLAILAALLTLLLVLPAQAEVQFQQVTSPKGIKAWLVEDHSLPLITIRFAFEGGTTQDPVGKEGLANLMTALFDEGAGDLDSEAFQIALDNVGAEMGFAADNDALYGSMRLLSEQRDEALDLLKLAIEAPRFDQNPIDRMRAQIVAGIVASAKDPGKAAQTLWAQALYGEHPYARRREGNPETLASVTADDLRALHKAIFARANLHVAIVGDIDAADAAQVLDMLFGALPEQPALTPVANIEPVLGKDLEVNYDLPQTAIYLAYPGIKRDAPDYFAAYLMNEILGGRSILSRLTAEVREQRGLAYNISSALLNFQHTEMLIIGTATRPDRAEETLTVAQDVIARLAKDGPTEAELASAKKYVIGSYPINELNSSSAIANTLVGPDLRNLGIDHLTRREELIEAVSVEDVKAVAAKLLTVKPTTLLIGPQAQPAP